MSAPPPSSVPGPSSDPCAHETAGYLDHRAESIYVVRHQPSGAPRGRVLLAGPLPDERTHAHLTWVRWARILAERGLEVMRFDYTGTGESTGSFERSTMTGWAEDIAFCVSHLRAEEPKAPVIVCGLRLGGLLAARTHSEGHGDALLTWSAHRSGEALLVDAARRQQAANIVQGIAGGVPGPRTIISSLESGKTAEINGYSWSPGLWADARAWRLEAPAPDQRRPILHLEPSRAVGSLPVRQGADDQMERVAISWPPFWVVGQRLIHETRALFERSLSFIEMVLDSTSPEGR